MKDTDHIKSHDEFASTYDSQVKEYNSYGHEVLFGMCYEYIKPGDSLLDLGIGTGLSSVLFAKAGLEITGLDGSREMLKECRKKCFAKELKQCDIQDVPLPYSDNAFSNIVCCGVFHFFGDLEPMFKEVSRIIKPGGIFAFTILAQISEKEEKSAKLNQDDYSEKITYWEVPVFMHSYRYIEKLLQVCGFDRFKKLKFLVWNEHENIDDLYYAFVVPKNII